MSTRDPSVTFTMFLYEDRIVLVPVRPMESFRGFLRGIDSTVPRDDHRL